MDEKMKLTEIAFFTKDVKDTSHFYQKLLGSDPVAQSDGMAIFMTGSTKIFIHRTYETEEGDLPPENHIAFTVANVDESVASLKSAGLEIEAGPQDYYWGRSAYLRAPDGQLIELIGAEAN